MPNVLTQGSTSIHLYDAPLERANRSRFRREQIAELDLANSLYVASGLYPARAFVLVRRSDYNKIDTYNTSLSLQFHDTLTGTKQTFSSLSVVQARCVSRGIVGDPSAIYLVELTDARGLVWNRWFQWPTSSFYNVLAPAYPGQYYVDSLSGGVTAWTWDTMLKDLWNQMTVLPAYPNLPITPTVTNQDFSFVGVSAWEAVNTILDLLGCTVAVDLTSVVTPYSIVDLTADDAALTALQNTYVGALEDDLEYIDTGAGRVPGTLVVYFHRRNQYYGTEETVRRDALQWSSVPAYSVSVAAPAPYTSAVGQHSIWSEFTVQYDVDGNPLAADVTTANAVAAQRATQYFGRLKAGTSGFVRQSYAGVLPFKTGSRLDGVYWHQGQHKDGRWGWKTEVTRGPNPAWDEVMQDVD